MTILCDVEGCSHYLPTGKDAEMALHRAKHHERCACGWVGLNHSGHVARLQRDGASIYGHLQIRIDETLPEGTIGFESLQPVRAWPQVGDAIMVTVAGKIYEGTVKTIESATGTYVLDTSE